MSDEESAPTRGDVEAYACWDRVAALVSHDLHAFGVRAALDLEELVAARGA